MNNCIVCNGNGWYTVKGLEGACRCIVCNEDGMIKPPADGVILREHLYYPDEIVAISIVGNNTEEPKRMPLKEIIAEKINNARRDLDITRDYLQNKSYRMEDYPFCSDPVEVYKDLIQQYTKLVGKIEAYYDVIEILWSGKYE